MAKLKELDVQCFSILDDDSLLEEDKVDKMEEIVRTKYPNMSAQQLEKTIMDVMWRHKDPSRAQTQLPMVVKVEEREMKIDIPSFERRVQLQKQCLELQAMEEEESKSEYKSLLQRTNQLSDELYGNADSKRPAANDSPLDQLLAMFDHSVTKARIEQALRSTGYDVISAANLILTQLKSETGVEQSTVDSEHKSPFFGAGKNVNVVCSFFTKNGYCLKSDCRFRHDIENRTCSFWLRGNCLAGDNCLFQHNLGSLSAPPSSTGKSTSTFSPETTPSFIPTSSSSPSSMPTSKASLIRLPLRKPKSIPWESSDPRFEKYNHFRKNAAKAEDLRKKFARISTESWKSNDGLKSKQYSTKANVQEEKYFDALKLADDELAKYSDSNDDEVWFEMHGYDFNDAIEQLGSSLTEVKKTCHKDSKIVFIVVPSTSDYSQYKKTTKPITIWLDHNGYRWEIHSCGATNMGSVIAIDPWSV